MKVSNFLFLHLKEVDTRCCGCATEVIYMPVGVFYIFCITCSSLTTLITIPLGTPQSISFIQQSPWDSLKAVHMQVFNIQSAFSWHAFQPPHFSIFFMGPEVTTHKKCTHSLMVSLGLEGSLVLCCFS